MMAWAVSGGWIIVIAAFGYTAPFLSSKMGHNSEESVRLRATINNVMPLPIESLTQKNLVLATAASMWIALLPLMKPATCETAHLSS